MIFIEVTLKSGDRALIGLNSNFVLYRSNTGGCKLVDGVHNNGGWNIRDSYEKVVKKIKEAIKKGE